METQQNNNTRQEKFIKWRKGLGWGLYDVGTSGYFLVFTLYLFPVYLAERIFSGNSKFELYWGVAQGVAVLLAVGVGLLLGKALDLKGLQKVAPTIVIIAPFTCLILPILVGVKASPFTLLFGYVLVHAIHLLSLTIYDASLTQISKPGADRAIVSGWAWGWGYLGGLACMALMEIGILFYPRYSGWDFGVGALFYLVVSLFAAKWLRQTLIEQSVSKAPEPDETTSAYRTPWRLLLSILFVVDGIAVFMSYTGLYGTRFLGLQERQMTLMLALLQLLAFPLTGIVATLGSRNVPKALLFCGIGWLVTVIILISASGIPGMLLTIVVVSTVVGSTQALLRALYADQILARKGIEGFGKYALVEKGAAFIGPVIAGSLIPFLGYKVVLFASGVSIMLGAFWIWKLTSKPDIRQAKLN